MSYVEFHPPINEHGKRPRIRTMEGNFFCLLDSFNGVEVQRQNYASGANWAYGILGPDNFRPGSLQTNKPTAKKPGFTSGWVGPNRPSTTFYTNRFNNGSWILGHLMNGAWGGSGSSWRNLTPLSHVANSNHKTIETQMNNYLSASYSYDVNSNNYRPSWYGIEYLVECSINPLAANNVNVPTNLYAYAPEFIRVSWRAIEILKPTNRTANQIATYLANCAIHPVPNLPNTFPAINGAIRNNGALTAINNNAHGGLVVNSGINLVAAQANNLDGSCDVFQF